MNNRVNELMKQAEVCDGTRPGLFFDKEVFAALIVKECIGKLSKPEYAMTHPEELSDYNRGWVNGRLLGIEHIKQHFGVDK